MFVQFECAGAQKFRDAANNLGQAYILQYELTHDSHYLIAYTTLMEAEMESWYVN